MTAVSDLTPIPNDLSVRICRVADLLRFETDQGVILVEEHVGTDLERVGLLDRIRPARQTLEMALAQVKPALDGALGVVRGMSVRPDQVEVEIGVTLTAEAGAVVARTSAQGHLKVKLIWTTGVTAMSSPGADESGSAENVANG
ncbi:CU044_2847 family protein [Micromonospora chokoriensis]|uniref:CU044_2847 family protein n=1 Tax=Micromonospora chokoriensis TaxID=356851 RepID=UPI0012F79CE0|nr:CU044_2847 family protein [Micromonospora chokoriensis]